MLFLAPHIQFPGMVEAYPFRPADAVVIIAVFLTMTSRNKKTGDSRFSYIAFICFCLSISSACWGYYYLSSIGLDSIKVDNSIMSYPSAVARKLLLLAICFFGFYWLAYLNKIDDKILLKYWFFGIAFATLMHIGVYLTVGDPLIQRAGVFKEGNFGGSYYLLSFFLMCISAREKCRFGKFGMFFCAIGILLTQSTSAISFLVILGVICFLVLSLRSNNKVIYWGWFVVGVVIVGFLAKLFFGEKIIEIFSATFTDKLINDELNSSSFSRYDRLSSFYSGLNMFLGNPILGVGIQGYAFAFPLYIDEFLIDFYTGDSRRIANNIYIEILAEQGIVGFIAMAYLVYYIAKFSFRSSSRDILAMFGFISVFASWIAFPSYTVSFHWLGFALLFRISNNNQLDKAKKLRRTY